MRLSKQVFKWQKRSMQRDAKSLFYLENRGGQMRPWADNAVEMLPNARK